MRVISQSPAAPAPSRPAAGARGALGALASPRARRYGEYAVGAATLVTILAALWMAFLYAPTDANQGDVQRIEYFHVAIAWIAYLAFFVVCVASIAYLWRRDERWDLAARASAEIGTVFTTLVLITGSIWGKAYWGTWWQWDARLTTTLILWFIYVGYLLLRSYTGRTESGARNAAVLGIVGFVVVPINYLSITWWRTLHPDPQLPIGQAPKAPASVVTTLLMAVLAFTFFYVFLMIEVYRLQRLQTDVERLRLRADLGD
jgi:heme exporter protein C